MISERFTFRPRVKPGLSPSITNAVNALPAGTFGSGLVRAKRKNQLATPKNSIFLNNFQL
jgi:hypothetical protein